jgi:hypothetical protein
MILFMRIHELLACTTLIGSVLTHAAKADPASDLASTAVISRTNLAFEATFVHKHGPRSFRVVGFDASTRAWYLIQYGVPVGVDHRGYRLMMKEGVLSRSNDSGRLSDSFFIEQVVAPSIFLQSLLRDNPESIKIDRADSGEFHCTVTLAGGSRESARHGLPPGMIAQDRRLEIWADHTGLPLRIVRNDGEPPETFDFEPTSLGKIPISRVGGAGEWTLGSVVWLPPKDPRFTLEGLRARAAKPDTRPAVQPAPTTPEQEEEEVQIAIDSGLVSEGYFSRMRWPLVASGAILVVVGVIAYVRSRRS